MKGTFLKDGCHRNDILVLFSVGVKRQLAELFALLALPVLALGENPQPDPSLCGPYPKHYKEIVWHWLESTLLDADSAKIEWEGDPKPTDLGRNGEHLYGWLVNFRVNSRNRFGTYTGKQSHGALIHDDKVIQGIGFGY